MRFYLSNILGELSYPLSLSRDYSTLKGLEYPKGVKGYSTMLVRRNICTVRRHHQLLTPRPPKALNDAADMGIRILAKRKAGELNSFISGLASVHDATPLPEQPIKPEPSRTVQTHNPKPAHVCFRGLGQRLDRKPASMQELRQQTNSELLGLRF